MSVRYKLRVYDASGTPRDEFSNFRYLAYEKEVNSQGLLQFDVNVNNPVVTLFEPDGQIEVMRTDPERGIDWYVDFDTLIRDETVYTTDENITYINILAPGDMHLLTRATVAWKADTDNRSKFAGVAAETIAKTLVTYNATNAATTANGRELNTGTFANNINVQADGATGNTLDLAVAWQPLLNALQRVADTGDGDFSLAKTGAQAWEFRWHAGQLGTDRSAGIKFSRGLDNMTMPQLTRNRLGERTVAIVGGQGEEGERVTRVRFGANYDAQINHMETFVQGSNQTTNSSLDATGDARLREMEAYDDIRFNARQTAAIQYGRDYDLGDLVTVSYFGIDQIKKISKVSVRWQPAQGERQNPETIRLEMVNPPGGA